MNIKKIFRINRIKMGPAHPPTFLLKFIRKKNFLKKLGKCKKYKDFYIQKKYKILIVIYYIKIIRI